MNGLNAFWNVSTDWITTWMVYRADIIFLEGERLLDNHDLCELLHVSKRTLQRYRTSGELPYQTIYHKTYYKESDVEVFIRNNFAKGDFEDDNKGNSG